MIVAAAARDWLVFRSLAAQEGWRVPEQELALHLQGRSSRAWAMRCEHATIGLITGMLHQSSAWIGNLIIAPGERRHGYGAALFDQAVEDLQAAGAETLWLTASVQGAPLYAKRGFHPVGEVERWVRRGGGQGMKMPANINFLVETVDSAVWGDDRSSFLRHLERTGNWGQQGESLALLQGGDDLQVIGPWYGSRKDPDDARLLARLVATAAPQVELVVDLLSHSGRQELLAATGFIPLGRTGLMVAGPVQVQWPRLVALASLGSCG